MPKEKLINKERGSITVFAIVAIFSLLFIIGGVFITTTVIRKNQLRTLVKIKDIYASQVEVNNIERKKITEYIGKPANNEEKILTEDMNGNPITIPPGFVVVANSAGTTSTDRKVEYTYNGDAIPAVQDGIVIEDGAGNQFVWIPVGTVKNKDGTEDKIELGRYEEFTKISKPLQSIDNYKSTTENDVTYQDKYLIGGYRELTQQVKNTHTIAKAINIFKVRAQINHGFYMARYEASQGANGKPMSQANQAVWSGLTQPVAAEKAKLMYNDKDSYESDLINSYAWDTALMFIQKYNKDEIDYANKEGKSISATAKSTGQNATDKVCNIYDMCGNYSEWSTESCNDASWPTTRRGGNYSQSSRLTKDRIGYNPTANLVFIGFRVIIY